MGRYFDFNKKDPKPISEKKARIRKHNAMIIEKRAKGELEPLGSAVYNKIVKGMYNRAPKRQFVRLSENGSILPNKFAMWSDGEYSELDY